jgi:hypothetical protein
MPKASTKRVTKNGNRREALSVTRLLISGRTAVLEASAGAALPDLPTADEMKQLALLYQYLANDLVAWQKNNTPGTEKDSNSPAVWKLHQIVRDVGTGVVKMADGIAKASSLLSGAGVALKLEDRHVAALIDLMTIETFAPLAPYSPLFGRNMW